MNGKLYIKKFIRDDGETLSFDAEEIYLSEDNTLLVRSDPATTAVDFTEADGGEMIRQRGAVYHQTVNGLIVPKTSDYWSLCTRLSRFFVFNHTYKIVYVKVNGSMFATNNAWISSGLQIVPVPHESYSYWNIEFAIGNIYWRQYAENSEGEQIYSNSITLPLITASMGGELWATDEVQTLSGEGSTFQIEGTSISATNTDVRLKGDTLQQGTPSPDTPIPVQTVAGEQTVKVSGKNLFDINNRNEIGGYFDGSQAVSTIVVGVAGRNRVIYIPCQPSTTYSFSFADLTDMNSPQVGTTTEIPDSGVTVNRLGVVSSTTLRLEGSTTPNDAKYIAVRFQTKTTSVDISTALANCLSKFQIEQSQTATNYEAYQGQSYMINLDGNLYDKNSAYKQGNDARLDISLKPNTAYVFNTGRAWTGAFLYDSNDTQTRKVGNDASLTHSIEFTTTAEEVKATLTFYIGSADIETYDFTGVIFYEVGTQIELCKIGDYQDYIYKDGNDWYLHKEINKATLPTSGYTRWSTHSEACMFYKNGVLSDALFQTGAVTAAIANLVVQPQVANMTAYYNNYAQTNEYGFVLKTETHGIMIQNKDTASLDDFHTWISSNPVEVRYVLATPIDTKITDATLVAQLNALASVRAYSGKTTYSTSGTPLPAIFHIEMTQSGGAGEVWDGVGGVWEAGSGGVQTISVDSTQKIYPVWTVTGPCVNPVLQNNTTDTFASFDGTVAAGQTLTVYFEDGIAYLDSAIATRYVSGYVSFLPGENMVGFNSDGGSAETSTISWDNIIN